MKNKVAQSRSVVRNEPTNMESFKGWLMENIRGMAEWKEGSITSTNQAVWLKSYWGEMGIVPIQHSDEKGGRAHRVGVETTGAGGRGVGALQAGGKEDGLHGRILDRRKRVYHRVHWRERICGGPGLR
jgi:hypothetical protein